MWNYLNVNSIDMLRGLRGKKYQSSLDDSVSPSQRSGNFADLRNEVLFSTKIGVIVEYMTLLY